MNTQPDFEELLRLFEENRVEYMVVGGYAVAFHGYPRFTKDIDVLYRLSTENIERLKRALVAFGFARDALPERLFSTPGNIIKFGIEPIRVDLLNDIDGVVFEEISKRAVRGRYGETEATFIGKEDLIANKRASGRAQDLADLERLENR
jgi:hypothetical protein